MIHIPHLRFYIMGHLVAKVSGVNEGAYSLYCPSWNVLWYLLFCLIWDKRDKWLLKLCRKMYSSKEQANRIPKQKKNLKQGCWGVFSSLKCLHADDPNKWLTNAWPSLNDIHSTVAGSCWEFNKKKLSHLKLSIISPLLVPYQRNIPHLGRLGHNTSPIPPGWLRTHASGKEITDTKGGMWVTSGHMARRISTSQTCTWTNWSLVALWIL